MLTSRVLLTINCLISNDNQEGGGTAKAEHHYAQFSQDLEERSTYMLDNALVGGHLLHFSSIG